MVRRSPPRTNKPNVAMRVKFDQSEGALPVLGDLVRIRRNGASRAAVGTEAGVGGHVVLSVENHNSAKAEELDLLLKWVGHTSATCQVPPPIQDRVYGRPRLDGSSEAKVIVDILEWVALGRPLSKYESLRYQINSSQAQKLVTRHLRLNKEFPAQFAAAKAIGAHHLIDQSLAIADDPNIGAGQAANAIRARQWAASKANPEVYGQNSKSEVNVSVGFGEALEQLERRRQENALPAPNLRVIDIEPLPLRTDERAAQVSTLADD